MCAAFVSHERFEHGSIINTKTGEMVHVVLQRGPERKDISYSARIPAMNASTKGLISQLRVLRQGRFGLWCVCIPRRAWTSDKVGQEMA